ncbi:MAG: hypothetical protein AABX51_08860 [Nanoarchaeota archaeon]|mgnify:CR=1 FL=1
MQKLSSNKKGQGISMETIVIAVIVVAVLVVLLLVFAGRINIFGKDLKNCAGSAGFCSSTCSNLEGRGSITRNYAKIFDITPGGEEKQCLGSNPPDGVTNSGKVVCCSIVGTEVA